MKMTQFDTLIRPDKLRVIDTSSGNNKTPSLKNEGVFVFSDEPQALLEGEEEKTKTIFAEQKGFCC